MHDLLRATDSSKNETQESSNELAIVYSLESLIHFFTTLFFVLQNFATIVPQIEQDLQTFTFSPLTLALQDPHLTLLRSTNLLKAIFHIYRGHTSFGAVEEVSDEYETLSYSRSDFFETTRNGCFIWADNPLGKIEFEGEKGEQALDTIVSTHECFNMVAFMGTIISTVLKGQYTKLEAVAGAVKNITRMVNETMCFSDQTITRGPLEEHWVIRITTLNGQVYALDLTGAQYGWYDVMMPWHKYTNDRFEKHSELIPQEYVRAIWNQENLTSGAHMLASSKAEDHVVRAIELSLKEWSRKEGIDMLSLFKLQEEEYKMRSFEMVLAAVMAMESLIGMFKRKKMFLWFRDAEGELRLTRSEKEARRVGV